MGFFKDFKRDFAQAVNELMPDPNEIGAEYDDEDMVNTFDEGDLMDIAPEDLLEDLDDIKIERDDFDLSDVEDVKLRPDTDLEEKKEKKEENIFDSVPQAEVISDQSDSQMHVFEDNPDTQEIVPEMLQGEKITKDQAHEGAVALDDTIPGDADDDLKALDALDEENMMEQTGDALDMEPEQPEKPSDQKLADADISRAVEDVLAKSTEEAERREHMQQEGASDMDMKLVSDKQSETDARTDKENNFASEISYITKMTTITGNVESDGDIDIIGTVVGDVRCAGKLIVGGSVQGNVDAGEVYANAAKIEGTMHVQDSVKIGVGSIVVGDVFAGSAVVAGAVKGDIDVQGPVIVDSTAVIMGNIKSRSVQINNGAVIEGMCSQCYSEIDVKSFFE